MEPQPGPWPVLLGRTRLAAALALAASVLLPFALIPGCEKERPSAAAPAPSVVVAPAPAQPESLLRTGSGATRDRAGSAPGDERIASRPHVLYGWELLKGSSLSEVAASCVAFFWALPVLFLRDRARRRAARAVTMALLLLLPALSGTWLWIMSHTWWQPLAGSRVAIGANAVLLLATLAEAGAALAARLRRGPAASA